MSDLEFWRSRVSYDPGSGIFTRLSGPRAGKRADTNSGNGYKAISAGGVVKGAHRVAYLLMNGDWPPEQMDHINGIRDDNRWENLRAVSHIENCRNLGVYARNKSGIPGVRWNERYQFWEAYIRLNNKDHRLGCHKTLLDAAAARKSAENNHGFDTNHGRRPTYRRLQEQSDG